MSEFQVIVVKINEIFKHPNADTLSITKVNGDYPVIFRTGDFKEGDLAAYIPVDSLVPGDDPRWSFLEGHRRIKAKRLRGIFSMGMLASIESKDWVEGQNVQTELRIEKWEPPISLTMQGENEVNAWSIPTYTDIEGLRKWESVLQENEQVVITEKIHGANARYMHDGTRIWCGSHHNIKREDPNNMWWRCASVNNLEEALKGCPSIVVYGEVYGQVQDLKYGAKPNDLFFRAFDALDLHSHRYLDVPEFRSLMNQCGVSMVPTLYEGPWSHSLREYAEGKTMLDGGHVREGFVVRPVKERFNENIGRVILKLVGEGYHLRKQKEVK